MTTNPSQRKCGAMIAMNRLIEIDPSIRQRLLDLENETRARRATGEVIKRGLLKIPVIVHVIYKTDDQNISDDQIQSQIDVLNKDFRAKNSDVTKIPLVWKALATDAKLEFSLDKVTRTQTIQATFSTDDSVKFSASGGHDVVTPDTHLNLWVCNISDGILGYAQFPGGPAATDGVVILYSAFGTKGTAAAPFNLGRTATHEIGHYLNLSHIWGESRVPNCSDDDFIGDTPTQLQPNYSKPNFPTISCNNGPSGDMFMNYMDYVDDDTMFMFTAQQVLRMRTALSKQRPKLGVVQKK
jgi:Pregnancy-associated plasma protein-A